MFENHDYAKPLLSPYQLAALRLFTAGIVMVPLTFKALKQVPKHLLTYTVLSGVLGSFIPAFLFCIAETKIGGAIAGSLNSLTPLFVIVVGASFFKLQTNSKKILGVLVGLAGSGVLIYANTKGQSISHTEYILVVVLATIFYGLNVNMVVKKLAGVPSTQIAAIAFVSLIIPSLLVLIFTGFFSLPFGEEKYVMAISAGSVLGVVGTAFASILFYMLMKKAGGVFASMVTYGIPFIAIGWGLIHHEPLGLFHFIGLAIILGGVYLANRD